jgi:hypothetical protein
MRITSIRAPMRWPIATACALATLAGVHVPGAVGDTSTAAAITSAGGAGNGQSGEEGTKPDATATLEQCVTALVQSERSATFVGEMTAVPGTARMEISIGLVERVPSEAQYRPVNAAGLGAWRGSAPSVKTYTYIKQVTNLSAPAFYRGVVRFRWLNAKGHLIKDQEMRTPRCEQPAASSGTGSEPPVSSTPPSSPPTTTTPSG